MIKRLSNIRLSPAAITLILFVMLSGIFITLAAWSWRKWSDLMVDFGHELYVPWQMLEGKVLYRDMVFSMGPLSQYYNALLFKLFGVSITTLIVANLVLLALLVVFIYLLLEIMADRLTAFVGCWFFLTVFAFSQYIGVGNYNYVTPYRHEMTHGIFLALLAMWVMARWAAQLSWPALAASSFLTGLIFLTKLELWLAVAPAGVCYWCLYGIARKWDKATWLKAIGIGLGAGGLPIMMAFAGLCLHLTAAEAWQALIANLSFTLKPELTRSYPFYAANMGADRLSENLRVMFYSSLVVTIGLVLLMIADRRACMFKPDQKTPVRWTSLLPLMVMIIVISHQGFQYEYVTKSARSLPLFTLLLFAVNCYLWYRHLCLTSESASGHSGLQHDNNAGVTPLSAENESGQGCLSRVNSKATRGFDVQSTRYMVWVSFSLLSFLLLLKMLFRARLDHYGFVLAMPATLLMVAGGLYLLPEWLRHRYNGGRVFKWLWIMILAAAAIACWQRSNYYYAHKTFAIGSPPDRILTYHPDHNERAQIINEAIVKLSTIIPESATLLVLPEGVTLNYLLRRVNPTPYYLLTPWEMAAFGGETVILDRIKASPPDFIALINIDMRAHGRHYFGEPGYGADIVTWVQIHYQPVIRVSSSRNMMLDLYKVYD